jgi:hypothetical protein
MCVRIEGFFGVTDSLGFLLFPFFAVVAELADAPA